MIDKIRIVIEDFQDISYDKLDKNDYKNIIENTFSKRFLKLYKPEYVVKGESPFLLVYPDPYRNQVVIYGSLRKFHTSKVNAAFDHNKSSFLECIEIIEDCLGIKKDLFRNAKITQIEIGANIRLESKYINILNCIDNYPKLAKKTYDINEPVEEIDLFKTVTLETESLYF